MSFLIDQKSTVIYILVILCGIIAIIVGLFSDHKKSKSMPKAWLAGLILLMLGGIGIIAFKLNIFPVSAEGSIKIIIGAFSVLGLGIIFVSGFLSNKKMGVKIDPVLKKIMIGSAIAFALCILAFVVLYNIVYK